MTHDAPARPPASGAATGDGPAKAVVFLTLVILVAGANVTTTASGDAIPTWPHGLDMSDAAKAIEMSHRIAAALGIVAAGLLWLAARRSSDAALRTVAKLAVAVIVVQAVLGGVRVLLGTEGMHAAATAFKVIHAVLGQVFFCIAVAAAALASPWWRDTVRRPLEDAGLMLLRGSAFALVALFVQLVLGALGRHDVIPREIHMVFALVAFLLTARVILVATGDLPREVELFRGPAALLGFLTAVQLVLGIAAYLISQSAPDPLERDLAQVVALNLHLLVGAGMLGLVLLILLRTIRLWGLPTDERIAEARAAQPSPQDPS
ncbi:MAG: hypothetical protein HMLKMBBP_01429 [Planctomycetes bacterium]|nr:hypothetical protein [Planctomycetota bacterium]